MHITLGALLLQFGGQVECYKMEEHYFGVVKINESRLLAVGVRRDEIMVANNAK